MVPRRRATCDEHARPSERCRSPPRTRPGRRTLGHPLCGTSSAYARSRRQRVPDHATQLTRFPELPYCSVRHIVDPVRRPTPLRGPFRPAMPGRQRVDSGPDFFPCPLGLSQRAQHPGAFKAVKPWGVPIPGVGLIFVLGRYRGSVGEHKDQLRFPVFSRHGVEASALEKLIGQPLPRRSATMQLPGPVPAPSADLKQATGKCRCSMFLAGNK